MFSLLTMKLCFSLTILQFLSEFLLAQVELVAPGSDTSLVVGGGSSEWVECWVVDLVELVAEAAHASLVVSGGSSEWVES